MLAQFQSLYPEGSLISELLQIYHGKYIVRASVQIEGVIRATGMAAAETLEDAEDQARSRALMVLGITNTPQESRTFSRAEQIEQVKPKPTFSPTSGFHESASPAEQIEQVKPKPTFASTSGFHESASPAEQIEQVKPKPTFAPTSGFHESAYTSAALNSFSQTEATSPLPANNDTNSQDFSEPFPFTSEEEAQFDVTRENLGIVSGNKAENNQLVGLSASNVTPFPSRSYSLQEDVGTETATLKRKKKSSEPVDHSEAIAKIDIEMERLGWTKDQGRDHLIKTYGKRARSLLNEEERLGFLKYLESQPTPPDPLAGF